MQQIKDRTWEFRKMLGARLKNQLRRVPELQFFNDDTLDYVFKMEEIFKKIKEEDEARKAGKQGDKPAEDTE